jgi:hypothetical protein
MELSCVIDPTLLKGTTCGCMKRRLICYLLAALALSACVDNQPKVCIQTRV